MKRQTADIISRAKACLLSRVDVTFAYLFGSCVTGKVSALSDIDMAIYLTGNDIQWKRLDILGELIDALKTDKVDLVLMNTAPLALNIRVLKHKYLLVDRRPFFRHRFESALMRSYFDFSKLEKRILYGKYFDGRQHIDSA